MIEFVLYCINGNIQYNDMALHINPAKKPYIKEFLTQFLSEEYISGTNAIHAR